MYRALEALQKRLGYQFKDQNLIIEALTHKSSKQPYNNERLEFLGDAVLDLIVGEYLTMSLKRLQRVNFQNFALLWSMKKALKNWHAYFI